MKKVVYITLVLILICSCISFPTKSYATSKHTASEIIEGSDGFISTGEEEYKKESIISEHDLQVLSKTIYNILLVLAIIIAVAMGVIIGIKMVTGGVEAQVEAKKMLVPYVMGCVVVFGAFIIWQVVVNILQSL